MSTTRPDHAEDEVAQALSDRTGFWGHCPRDAAEDDQILRTVKVFVEWDDGIKPKNGGRHCHARYWYDAGRGLHGHGRPRSKKANNIEVQASHLTEGKANQAKQRSDCHPYELCHAIVPLLKQQHDRQSGISTASPAARRSDAAARTAKACKYQRPVLRRHYLDRCAVSRSAR